MEVCINQEREEGKEGDNKKYGYEVKDVMDNTWDAERSETSGLH